MLKWLRIRLARWRYLRGRRHRRFYIWYRGPECCVREINKEQSDGGISTGGSTCTRREV